MSRTGETAELIENFQGPLPGSTRGFPVAAGMAGVSEVVKYGCLQLSVAEFVVEVKSLLIAGGGVLIAAEVMMDVAEAVESVGQAAAIPQFSLQGKCLLAQGQGLVLVSELAAIPADVIERVGLPGAVPGGEVQAEGPLGMVQCIGGTILIVKHPAEHQVGFGLAGLIAELRELGQRLLEMDARFRMAAEPLAGARDALAGEGFAPPTGVVSWSGQGEVLGDGKVVPLPLAGEVVSHRPGQLPGVCAPSTGCQLNGGEQHRVLDVEPCPGCCVAGALGFWR